MTRKAWLIPGAALVAAGVSVGVHFWRVQRPPAPSAAVLPASARVLLSPFRKDSLELTVGRHEELDYRVGMQSGATLVYAWSTSPGEMLSCEFPGQKASQAAEGHGAFEARSSGWYHWRWKNPGSQSVAIRLRLSGYYELAGMPYDK